MINPSPYVRISAIEFVSISTDLPKRFPLSWLCSVDVRFNRLCASSKTVMCFKSLFISPLVILYSCSFKTSNPIIKDFVSAEPTRLKSTITFLSNKSSFLISSVVNTSPFIPLDNDFKRVIRAPLYAPLFSLSYSELSIIVRIFRVISAKVGYKLFPYSFVDSVKFHPQSS